MSNIIDKFMGTKKHIENTFNIKNIYSKSRNLFYTLKSCLFKNRVLRLLEIIALIFTAYFAYRSWQLANESKNISDETYRLSKVDLRQRNRPFLTIKINSQLFNILTEMEVRKSEGIEFDLIVKNHGEVPAYRVSRYLFAVADKIPIFSLYVTTENIAPTMINGIPSTKATMHYTNNIIPPNEIAAYKFFVPKKQISLLLDAKDRENTILACGLQYAGPLDKYPEGPYVPYYYQENFSLWINRGMVEIISKGQFGN